jgi:hypothetical protein
MTAQNVLAWAYIFTFLRERRSPNDYLTYVRRRQKRGTNESSSCQIDRNRQPWISCDPYDHHVRKLQNPPHHIYNNIRTQDLFLDL